MLGSVKATMPVSDAVLVLDTCGERASLSLHRGVSLLSEELLAERTASQGTLAALRTLLTGNGLTLEQLAGVGVVHGPGSFTGVRVGLALAKGLCEAARLPCAPVSRLAVLAHAADLRAGYALLPAGRGQVYARTIGGDPEAEAMLELEALLPQLRGETVAVAHPELAESLRGRAAEVRLVELRARHAIVAVLAGLARGGADLATLDANYVRDEGVIYGHHLRRPSQNRDSGDCSS